MRLLWLLVVTLLSVSAYGVIETYEFDTDLQRQRYNAFVEELRCPKCQNQNLSGSDSAIAVDLRRQVHSMIMDGKSDMEITQYMVDRYGDFILYKPRFSGASLALWLTPLVLLGIGVGVWLTMSVRRNVSQPAPTTLDDAQRARLESLLEDDKSANGEGR
ncbi:cytochrome c-type biogenesis protein CcmH [Spongiibacter sp. KMU-166]|uniref:Cytochrome c-type biogenesis protein n=1 Tax=Spongiibacter thalassae TaxID=2721624 RepID=A0ABX1GCS2_9GAMM|nr:cytochrome c-type biogenesis protein [Spongiibacter thalassae]NKI16970.1 cytochrome c-type biogenesis protein CcmH [Spongiibacter thalassae]